MPSCHILKPGIYTSLQDRGRKGMAFYAIPPSGYMDAHAATLANRLIGNNLDYPVIECSLAGPTIAFDSDALISITGADMQWQLDRLAVPINQTIHIKKGQILKGGYAINGLYGYIAIQGKIEATLSYGSSSGYSPAELGHLKGRPYNVSDRITWQIADHYKADSSHHNIPDIPDTIQLIKGPEYHLLDKNSQHLLTTSQFLKTSDSNRMGARLSGPILKTTQPLTHSVPVVPGHMQLAPSGQPIVVLNDGQTTGGYPRIALLSKEMRNAFNRIGIGKPMSFKVL